MCGIAGILTTAPDSRLSAKAVRATHALHHRGPDEAGFLVVRGDVPEIMGADGSDAAAEIVAGSCRLSIVDIAGGHQPLANETSSVWITYNGEIYNHAELREELESLGHRFRTNADTEVVVHGWEEWDTGLLTRLNGIFAFAIFDLRTHEVVLARDPLGVKPLFLGTDGPSTWWCSELAPAAAAGLCSKAVDADALRLFLTFRFVPSPFAIWSNAWKVPPSSYVRLGVEHIGSPPRFERYSSDVRSSFTPRGRDEWERALMEELELAVTRQLAADVPVASLLSGGIDSTLMTLFMTSHLAVAPQTFSVGFASDGNRSELEAAALSARELGAPFHGRTLLDEEYEEGWPALVARMGEPTGNTSATILHSICADVDKSHKVALCGQGADELLGGYPRHVAERFHPLGRRAPRLAATLAGRLYHDTDGSRLRRIYATPDRIDRYLAIFAHLSPDEVDRLVPRGSRATAELARDVLARWASDEPPADPLNELLRIDARVSLADDLLLVADLCSMYRSVELRMPFLDLAFVELAERMPSRYKVGVLGNRKCLYLLAAAARLPVATSRRLCGPANLLQRKRGFSPPAARPQPATSEPAWLTGLLESDSLDGDALRIIAARREDGVRGEQVLHSLSRWAAAQYS